MKALMKAGVDGQRILDWNDFLGKAGIDVEAFCKDLEAYAGVKEAIVARGDEVKVLELSADDLRAQIGALEGEKAKVVNSIKALRIAGIAEIEKVSSAAIGTIGAQRSEAEGSVRALRVAAIDEVNATATNVKKNVLDMRTQMTKEASLRLQEAKAVIVDMKADIEGTYEKALETGKRLGEFKFMEPLIRLISSREGDPVIVYAIMYQLCLVLGEWLGNNPPKGTSTASNLLNLSNSLREEMASA
jgi:hypothetical protein